MDVHDQDIQAGIVKKQGAWLSYNDMHLGQGREKAKDFLRENPDLASELKTKIMAAINSEGSETTEEAPQAKVVEKTKK